MLLVIVWPLAVEVNVPRIMPFETITSPDDSEVSVFDETVHFWEPPIAKMLLSEPLVSAVSGVSVFPPIPKTTMPITTTAAITPLITFQFIPPVLGVGFTFVVSSILLFKLVCFNYLLGQFRPFIMWGLL